MAAAVAGPAAAAEAAAAAAACPAAVGAAGADAAAFAVTVDAAAAGAAVGAGFCVQSSCLALSSGAARKHELLLLPCRQASQMLKREGKGREGKGREGKGREGTELPFGVKFISSQAFTPGCPAIKQNLKIPVILNQYSLACGASCD